MATPASACDDLDPLAGGSTLVARPEGAAAMSVVALRQTPIGPCGPTTVAGAGPAKAGPRSGALARVFLRRVAIRTGIRVETADGSHFGPVDGPIMAVHDPGGVLREAGSAAARSASASPTWLASGVRPIWSTCSKPWPVRPTPLSRVRCRSLRRWYDARQPRHEDNDRSGAVRNIARHYDLSNELFATFLDPFDELLGRSLHRRAHHVGPGSSSQDRKVVGRHRSPARYSIARNRHWVG